MFISYWLPEYSDDAHVQEYIERFETLIDPAAPDAIDIKKKYPWVTGRVGNWWVAHYYECCKILSTLTVRFKENGTWSDVSGAIAGDSPVVIGTKFGQGHIILIVGETEKDWICHDPYGVAPDYKKTDGAYVYYDKQWLKTWRNTAGKSIGENPIIMYAGR
jgi:hypothetical protein